MKPLQCDVLIVGGGLAGLALAVHLENADMNWQLIEARNRFGGRIRALHDQGAYFDLGPSWFWSGQPRMAAMVQRLGLTIFTQYASGDMSYEDEKGTVHRGKGHATMEGSYRIKGGMSALIDGLVAQLPTERLHLNCIAKLVERDTGVQLCDGSHITAKSVVLAIPPRIAAELHYSPILAPSQLLALRGIPTWMGGQAKFMATYDTPFWRDAGLSGGAMSRHGPLAEIHDASAKDGTAALFGFVGVPIANRENQKDALIATALAQLGRIFGSMALQPRKTELVDWAFETATSTLLDHQTLGGHPAYGLPPALKNIWKGQLHFASTEAAPQFGGYLEGAFEAAEIAAETIL